MTPETLYAIGVWLLCVPATAVVFGVIGGLIGQIMDAAKTRDWIGLAICAFGACILVGVACMVAGAEWRYRLLR